MDLIAAGTLYSGTFDQNCKKLTCGLYHILSHNVSVVRYANVDSVCRLSMYLDEYRLMKDMIDQLNRTKELNLITAS